MITPLIVLVSVIVTLTFFIEKPSAFRAIVVLVTSLGDLVFLMGSNNL